MVERAIRRRTFLGTTVVAALAAACRKSRSESGEATIESAAVRASAIPRRPLGVTGVTVSAVGIGGYHLGFPKDEAEAIRIIHAALDRGIDFLDNSWDYHDGKSEDRMGKALADGHRKRAFLMTKLDGRTKKVATEQLEQSLRRLRTDVIDLVQIHEVIRADDPPRSFAPGGVIEALVDARKAGKLRFFGFTGHKDPSFHLAMLDAAAAHKFRFDTVQMPLNVLDAHFRSFEKLVLPRLVAMNIGVLGMKPLASGRLLKTNTVDATEALHYAMNLPTSVVITGCESMQDLEQAIRAALTFEPMMPAQVDALLARTKAAAAEGKFETFKTTDEHDGTSKHPEWLG
jgi:predicted aldo/keto reductase-like oxidoreductase